MKISTISTFYPFYSKRNIVLCSYSATETYDLNSSHEQIYVYIINDRIKGSSTVHEMMPFGYTETEGKK